MRDIDDAALELRLREVLKERLGTLPLDLTVETLDQRRVATGRTRRFGRGRGMTLLAAAATVALVGGALAAGSGVLRLRSNVPPAPSLGLLAIASPDATPPSPSDLAEPSASPISAAGTGGTWIQTGSLINPGDGLLVRLLDGRVLAAGGGADGTAAELYDPTTGTWSATGSMIQPAGAATLLADGRVFVIDDLNWPSTGAELFDPATGTWKATAKPSGGGGPMLLGDGRVLLVDGNSPEIYDPASDTWTATSKMLATTYESAAVLLPDGRVLVAGGWSPCDRCPIKSAELYDPQTNSWTATADLPKAAAGMQAALLQDGTALFVGGDLAVVYDPATGTWTSVDKPASGGPWHPIPLLDGRTLLTGNDGAWGASELYDPATRSWTQAASMVPNPGSEYGSSQGTLLLDGTVLFQGGVVCRTDSPNSCRSGAGWTERYIPAGVAPPTGLAPVPSPTPTPVPTPTPSPFPPMAGPVPQGARPWDVTVENKSSRPATLFLAGEPLTDMSQLCGSITPDVVPAHTTETVTFQLPPKSVNDCWLMVLPGPGAGGAFGPTDGWPIPGPRKLVIQNGGDNKGPDDVSSLWEGP